MTDTADTRTVEERVRKIVIDQLGVEAGQVTNVTRFVDDLGADDLDMAELLMSLEEAFDIEVPDGEKRRIITVQQAIDYAMGESQSE
ncbi:acyl carrier protein [Streptomyces sp. NPDC008163]|uniref:acyl carrier protein n=1 Tax=Streptomyces sp. NPDC008163 TaxID=3364818 RepID=UPI0036F10138